MFFSPIVCICCTVGCTEQNVRGMPVTRGGRGCGVTQAAKAVKRPKQKTGGVQPPKKNTERKKNVTALLRASCDRCKDKKVGRGASSYLLLAAPVTGGARKTSWLSCLLAPFLGQLHSAFSCFCRFTDLAAWAAAAVAASATRSLVFSKLRVKHTTQDTPTRVVHHCKKTVVENCTTTTASCFAYNFWGDERHSMSK